MEGQSLLEGMACWGMAGNLQSSAQDAEGAVTFTERSRYGALHLRSLAFMAFLATEKGDEDSSGREISPVFKNIGLHHTPPSVVSVLC